MRLFMKNCKEMLGKAPYLGSVNAEDGELTFGGQSHKSLKTIR